MADEKEPFIARWSRRKLQAAEQPASKPATGEIPAPAATQATPVAGVAPSVDASAFSQYFDPKIDVALRKAALRKLFSDPHFNVMDGLDTYIDDYSIPDPLPPELMRQLHQAKELFLAEEEKQVECGASKASGVDGVVTDTAGTAQCKVSDTSIADIRKIDDGSA